jgi:glycerol uptake facilitator-like aquaporin
MRPKQYLALRNIMVEFFGTLALVYFSNWANLLYELKMLSLAGYGIVYGLILSLLIYIGLDTSGGHYDPSVTVTKELLDTLAELSDS